MLLKRWRPYFYTLHKLFDVLVLAATKAEKDLSGTDMYLHAKFHADR